MNGYNFIIKVCHQIVSVLFLILAVSSDLYSQTDVISFEGVNVIPMDKDTLIKNQRVVIVDGVIDTIMSAAIPATNDITLQIDAEGKYLIPGLADMHTHNETDIENEFKLFLSYGVTTIRNMHERAGQDLMLIKESIENGNILAPNFYTTGPSLHAEDAATIKDAEDLVKGHVDRGYDYMKIHGDFPKDIYIAILREANKQGLSVVGHGQSHLPLEYSLRLSSIAHVEEFMKIFTDAQETDIEFLQKKIDQIKASGVVISPTLRKFSLISSYIDDEEFAQMKELPELKYLPASYKYFFTSDNAPYRRSSWFMSAEGRDWVSKKIDWQFHFTKMLHQDGIPLMAGSDATGLEVNGFGLHRELAALSDAGLTNYEVLRSATIVPARFLGRIATLGSISIGKDADLVLLNHNPLEDISNTLSIEGVMLNGEWMDNVFLDSLLQNIEQSVKDDRVKFDIHPMAGAVTKNDSVTIWSLTDVLDLRFTDDGSIPSESSKQMRNKVVIATPDTIKIKAIKNTEQYQDMLTIKIDDNNLPKPTDLPNGFGEGGLNYYYYKGEFNGMPRFEELVPTEEGIVSRDYESILPYGSNYAYQINGYINIVESGKYMFILRADDGCKVQLNGEPIMQIDESDPTNISKSYIVTLQEGFYSLELQYYQKDKGRQLYFEYIKPDGLDKFEVVPISPSNLYHMAERNTSGEKD